MNVSVLIPAYNPDQRLTELVKGLLASGIGNIIVVNDGSNKANEGVFSGLSQNGSNGLVVLSHQSNKGKGAALKTGLSYFCENCVGDAGVVTADADGQHSIGDIVKLARQLGSDREHLIIGVRDFASKVPLRSRFGNWVSAFVFRLLFHTRISDTQSGLRGIPRNLIPALLEIPYDRYEFETEMLIVCRRNNYPIVETGIDTIYLDSNRSSHFNPLFDSLKIYFILLRYVITSFITALVDYFVFINLHRFVADILLSTYISRFLPFSSITFSSGNTFSTPDKECQRPFPSTFCWCWSPASFHLRLSATSNSSPEKT